jgi:hypothetical protein
MICFNLDRLTATQFGKPSRTSALSSLALYVMVLRAPFLQYHA